MSIIKTRKNWFIVSAGFVSLFVAAVLFMGGPLIGGSGVSNAQSETDVSPDNPASTLIERVARILELEPDQVSAAFNQAEKEIENEGLRAELDEAVKDEQLTAEEADALMQWWEARPDIENNSFRNGMMPFHAFGEMHHFGPHFGDFTEFGFHFESEPLESMLDALIEDGIMSTEDAEEMNKWMDGLPEGLESFGPNRAMPPRFRFEGGWGKDWDHRDDRGMRRGFKLGWNWKDSTDNDDDSASKHSGDDADSGTAGENSDSEHSSDDAQ